MKLLGHHEADVAAADDGHRHGVLVGGEAAFQAAHAVRGSHEHHLVTYLQHRVSGGNSEVVAAYVADHQDAFRQADLGKRPMEEGIALFESVLEQLDAAAGERGAVERPRYPHDIHDLIGQGALRPEHPVDDEADSLHGTPFREGVHITLTGHEGHRLPSAQTLGRQAGEDVHIVVGGAGYEGIGLVGVHPAQILWIRAVTAQELNVHAFEGLLAALVDIQNGDVVPQVQGLGDLQADLPTTNDDHIHSQPSLNHRYQGSSVVCPEVPISGDRSSWSPTTALVPRLRRRQESASVTRRYSNRAGISRRP